MPDPHLERRKTASLLFAAGVHRAEVARRLGVSRMTATRWYRRWQEGGARALVRTRRPGRRPKIPTSSLADVQAALARGPRASGFDHRETWSLAAIVALIERHTGIAYHARHVARVLRRLGWVIPPIGDGAATALRQSRLEDPDGNAFFLREQVHLLPEKNEDTGPQEMR